MSDDSRHSYMEEDDAEKHDVATLLISLSPQRTKSTSHVTPDMREGFGSPSVAAGLWTSPTQQQNASSVGLPDFGSPLPPTPNGFMTAEMSPFSSFAAKLSPLPSALSQTPTMLSSMTAGSTGAVQTLASSSSSSSCSSSSSSASATNSASNTSMIHDSRLRGLNSATELLGGSPAMHTTSSSSSSLMSSTSSSSILGMSPLTFSTSSDANSHQKDGSSNSNLLQQQRRTKSVITPESKHQVEGASFEVGRQAPDIEPRTWISVKVSPSLSQRRSSRNCFVDQPVSGAEAGGGATAEKSGAATAGPTWGSVEKNEFDNAIKTINSKFKACEHSAVILEHAPTTQPPTSATKKKKSGKAKTKAVADEDEDYEIQSPPNAGLARARSRVSASSTQAAADLFARSNTKGAAATASLMASSSSSPPLSAGMTNAHPSSLSLTVGSTMESGGFEDHLDPESGDAGARSKPCNCKNSKCLKLYCDCFAMSRFCTGCNCRDCYNNEEHDDERKEAIKSTLEKNPLAFQAKIKKTKGKARGGQEHSSGCHCKKSRCLKKYCECFEAAVFCGDKCKCLECENFDGSDQLTHHRKTKARDVRKQLPAQTMTPSGSVRLERHLETEQQQPVVTSSRTSSRLQAATAAAATTAAATAVSTAAAAAAALPPMASPPAPISTPASPPSSLSLVSSSSCASAEEEGGGALDASPLSSKRARWEEGMVTAVPTCPPGVSPVAYVFSGIPETAKLVILVFECLNDTELYRCSLVCKAWTQPAFDPQLWVYDHVSSEEEDHEVGVIDDIAELSAMGMSPSMGGDMIVYTSAS